MAQVNPLIQFQSKQPTADKFGNALMNIQNIEKTSALREQLPIETRALEAKTATAEAAVPSAEQQFSEQEKVHSASVAEISRQIIPSLKSGNVDVVVQQLQERLEKKRAAGVDTQNTEAAIELAQTNPTELLRRSEIAVDVDERVNKKTGQASAKTEILESGATIQALPSGEVIVKNKQGENVTGDARLDVLEEARAAKIKAQQARADITVSTARRVKDVEKATATADKAFGMVDKLRENIANLEQVTPLIGEGADTGPISQLFPSVKAATVKLEQLQKRLSLDVVGAVTFGALSKGELDLAKAVALPLGLKGDDLIEWTNDTIAAKKKLANYFEGQAIFLGDGKSQSDWLKFKRAELKSAIGDASEVDIRKTMRDNNMTRPEVITELKRRNVSGR